MLLTEFKIRPTKRARLYYTVKVFDTVENMHKYAATGRQPELCYTASSETIVGMCTNFGYLRKGDNCGEVLFCKTDLDLRVVVHELGHTMYGLKREKNVGDLRIDKSGGFVVKDEEWCVDAIGFMTETVYKELLKKELI